MISRLFSIRLAFHAMGVIKILVNLAKMSHSVIRLFDDVSDTINLGSVNKMAAAYLVYATNWPDTKTTKDLLTSD